MRDIVIASAVRTPIGDFNGTLRDISATELGAVVIAEAVLRAGIQKNDVDEVIMGTVLPAGLGQNPARQAMLKAGLPVEAGAITVNKVCGSGLKAVMLAAQAISSGDADIIVAGGMENMNRAPYYLDKARFGYRMNNAPIIDGMIQDGIWDIISDFHMGAAAEISTRKYGISREDMDDFAYMSVQRALASVKEGRFTEEIVPVAVPQKKGDPLLFSVDETPRHITLDGLKKLRPAFKKDGCVTAGNASKISDGAAALVIMSRSKAQSLGIQPLATVGAQGSAGMELEDVLMTPIKSIPKVLKKAGMSIDAIDLHEVNEAFAATTVAIARELGIPLDRLNVNGGAVALGHPIGASGARVLVTLLHAMKQRGAATGMASLCLGGAEAVSLIVTRDR